MNTLAIQPITSLSSEPVRLEQQQHRVMWLAPARNMRVDRMILPKSRDARITSIRNGSLEYLLGPWMLDRQWDEVVKWEPVVTPSSGLTITFHFFGEGISDVVWAQFVGPCLR